MKNSCSMCLQVISMSALSAYASIISFNLYEKDVDVENELVHSNWLMCPFGETSRTGDLGNEGETIITVKSIIVIDVQPLFAIGDVSTWMPVVRYHQLFWQGALLFF